MKIWTVEEEAAKLRERFKGVNRAAFARDHSIKGGQAMIYQHITGRRPMSLEAAASYATGFGCTLAEISPRLALEIDKAATLNPDSVARTGPLKSSWPFPSISEKDVRDLKPGQLNALEGAIALAIAQLKLGVSISPKPAASKPGRGSVVDMDEMDDPFFTPLQAQPEPPWSGGKTTLQMEREGQVPFGIEMSLVTNVAPGEPIAANEKFEKVLELADVRLAAGNGIEADNELVTGAIQFRQSFLRSVGADKGRGRVVYAKGDSMEPDIKDGWALLVVPDDSLTIRDLVPNTVYAINYDGKMVVKVIAKDPLTGKWIAKSANRKYRDFPLEVEGVSVRVLGRVVWAGGRLLDGDAGRTSF